MMKIPLEVWWSQILPKLDDETLFKVIQLYPVDIDSKIFWEKRIEDRWESNVVNPPEASMETYLEIVNKWNEFVKHDGKIEIFRVNQGAPCKTPYHFSLFHDTGNLFTQKSIVCGPSYVNKEWMEQNEVLEFYTMRDLLNWRMRTIENLNHLLPLRKK